MTLLADKDERFKGLFVKVSIFVLLAVIGVASNFFYAAVRQGLFVSKTKVYFIAPSSQDIHEGMAVKLSGFKIGSVKRMSLNDNAETRVDVLIEDRYMHFIRQDAEISPIREGVIGDTVLAVIRGSRDKPVLRAGGEIKYVQSGGLEQLTQDLRDRLFPAINDMSKLLHDVNDPNGDIRRSLRNLRKFSDGLNATQTRLDHFLDHGDALVTKDFGPTVRALNQVTDKLNKQLPELLNKADATMDSLQKSAVTIQSTVDASGPQISGLVGESRGLVHEARKTVDSLNSNWLLRSGVPPEPHGTVKMDSSD